MRHHSVPDEMQRHVQRWYDYAWSRGCMNGGGDINALGLLPDKLKTELALHVNLETLKKVTIFHECEPEFLHDLVLKMKTYIFTPGDLICRKGEVAREMFIIADGLLEVLSESGEILSKMSAGDFFGEIGILNMDGGVNKRTADVRSVGYSELIVLSRDDVLSALRDHPEAESLIKEYGHRRLHELGARRKRNLNPDSGVVSQLVGNIVGLKKPLATTDPPPIGQNNGNKIDSETATQQFSNLKTSQRESPPLLNDFPAKNETCSVQQLIPGFETTQHVPQPSCNQKTSSRKSSYSGSKGEIVTDKSEKDEEIRPLTKTTTTDTLISNGSSVLACFMSEPVGLNFETSPLTNLHILTQQPHQPGEQIESESLDSYPEISMKMRKSSFGNQLSTQSENVTVRPSTRLELESQHVSVFESQRIPVVEEGDKILRKLNSLEEPQTKSGLTSWENLSDVDEQMFAVDELSSTIAACMKNFFESKLQNLKTRVTLLEADNLAKSQQIQVLNSMLEQKMKEADDVQPS